MLHFKMKMTYVDDEINKLWVSIHTDVNDHATPKSIFLFWLLFLQVSHKVVQVAQKHLFVFKPPFIY